RAGASRFLIRRGRLLERLDLDRARQRIVEGPCPRTDEEAGSIGEMTIDEVALVVAAERGRGPTSHRLLRVHTITPRHFQRRVSETQVVPSTRCACRRDPRRTARRNRARRAYGAEWCHRGQ